MVDAAAAGQEQVVLLLLAHDEELLQELLELLIHLHRLVVQRVLDLDHEVVTALLEGTAHAEAELGVVLEQGVGPGGTLT